MSYETTPNVNNEQGEAKMIVLPTKITDILIGKELTDDQIAKSAEIYNAFHSQIDSPQRIGLYGEDLKAAHINPDAVLLEYEDETGEKIYEPFLVPIKDLHWYNEDLLGEQFEGKKIWCYVHPPVNEQTQAQVIESLRQKALSGDVVITDEISDIDDNSLLFEKATLGGGTKVELIGYNDRVSVLDVYAGPVKFDGVEQIKPAPSAVEQYRVMLKSGEIMEDSINGPALYDVIEGEDARRLWEIYEAPFDKLSESNPIKQGFSEQEFYSLLRDKDIFKLVNRVDGKISTLMIIVEDFDKCPWFSSEYYNKHYGDYYSAGSVLIFPGIVSDEDMRGGAYSINLIDLGLQVYRRRGSNVLLTFECAEVSTEYIPGLVEFAINNSGSGRVQGLQEPISTVCFKALVKN